MAEREIGFGVVGLGMGAYHASAITQSNGAKLIALCDADEERLNKTNEKFKVKAYTNYNDMLKDKEVEVVNICTPSYLHVDMAILAINSGKHIIVEKPVDINVDKINKLIEVGNKAEVKMSAIFQSRTYPLNKRIKDVIDKGRLGKMIGIHGLLPWYRAESYYQGKHGSWKGTWEKDGGGSLMNQGVHTVDLLQWFGGRVKSVFGAFNVFAHNIGAEDTTVAVLKFENGAIGTIATTTCAYPGLPQQVLLYGENGTISKEEEELKVWKIKGEREKEEETEMLNLYGSQEKRDVTTASDPMAVGSSGHVAFIENMVDAIINDKETLVTIESAKHAVEIVTAVYESGKTGKEVFI